jgi:predicted sulfurtransferase
LIASLSSSAVATTHTYISFFQFEPIEEPSVVADSLRVALKEENFRGTIYVAPEVYKFY